MTTELKVGDRVKAVWASVTKIGIITAFLNERTVRIEYAKDDSELFYIEQLEKCPQQNYAHTVQDSFVCRDCARTSLEVQQEMVKPQKKLLDEFAIAALPAVLAEAKNHPSVFGGKTTTETEAILAEKSYDLGQAMMQEKLKRESK